MNLARNTGGTILSPNSTFGKSSYNWVFSKYEYNNKKIPIIIQRESKIVYSSRAWTNNNGYRNGTINVLLNLAFYNFFFVLLFLVIGRSAIYQKRFRIS